MNENLDFDGDRLCELVMNQFDSNTGGPQGQNPPSNFQSQPLQLPQSRPMMIHGFGGTQPGNFHLAID